MMLHTNIRLAWESIKRTKWRSLMTMLGIIIGTASVITTVGIGEGVRSQVSQQIDDLGTNLIIVRPGNVNYESTNVARNLNPFGVALTPLTDDDVKAVAKTPGVKASAPLMVVTGLPSYEKSNFAKGVVLGTTSDFTELIRQDVEFGQFLNENDEGNNFAVIGKNVAVEMFKKNVPIGRTLQFRGEDLVVKGVFPKFASTPFATGVDLDNAIFISYATAQNFSKDSTAVFEILAEPAKDKDRSQVATAVEEQLTKNHAGQKDFSVLTQEDVILLTDRILVLLTGLVAGIAAISLFVGGVGIMNVMLVSVTERTKEIGIRKAIGATSRQILTQFLVEAMMLSIVGSILGIIVAAIANILFRIFTNFQPVMTWQVVLIAVGVSVITGVLFGVAPAVKAAKKDPIDALRYE